MATDFTPVGWGAMPADHHHRAFEDDDDASLPSPGPGQSVLPAEVLSAFLSSHRSSAPDETPLATTSLSTQVDGDAESAPLVSMGSEPLQQPLHNPFAATGSTTSSSLPLPSQIQQQPPTAPGLGNYAPCSKRSSKQPSRAQRGAANQHQPVKKRSLLKRIVRGLLSTAASTGLLAAGAWAGMAAYRHYMAQLDDRDQLARRVSELARQEQKLLLRCTAIEQERSALTDKVDALTTAVAEGQEAQSKLRHRLQQMESDRDEAVRHNLNLQRKLTALEEGHSALSSAHKEQAAALEASKSEAAQLVKENKQLHATAEKLQARCTHLESANDGLTAARNSWKSEAEQYKIQLNKLAVVSQS